MLLALCLCTACNSRNIRDIADIAAAEDPAKQAGRVLEQKGREIASNPAALPEELRKLRNRIEKFKKLINAIWGEEDAPESGPKDYVKYTDKPVYDTTGHKYICGSI